MDSPSDDIPVWSRLNPGNMTGVSKCLKEAMKVFSQKWEQLYINSILKQNKWFATNHSLGLGDLVFIRDLHTEYGHPRLARITDIEQDTSRGV